MTLATLALVAAALAVVASLVHPAVDRWGWAAATLLVAAWVALAGEPLSGGLLLAGALVAALIDTPGDPVPMDFNSIVGRLAVLGLAVLGAVVLVVRLLSLDAGLNPEVVLLSATGIAALLHMTARPGPAAEARAARTAVAAGAAGWAATGHPGGLAVATAAVVLVLLALAGRGIFLRAGRTMPARPAVTVLALVVVGVVLALLPPDASLGRGDAGVSLRGLSRVAVLATAWALGVSTLAAAALRRRPSIAPWIVAAVAVAISVLRLPVGVAGVLLLAAITLPRLAGPAGSAGWSRTLILGALGAGAVAAAGVAGRLQGDDAIAAALVLGFLSAAAAAPFGWHVTRWMEAAPPELGALVGSGFLAGALAALVAAEPALVQVHAGQRAGLLLGIFGGVTAVLGGLYALGARDWRSLAVRTTPGEVGLAMVAVGAFDIRGLQGAALTLALLAVTRPVLLFADDLGPRRGAGLLLTALALLGAAGVPPTLGFPARVLVLSAAARLGPVVAVLAVAGVLVEVAAIVNVLRHRLAQPAADLPATNPGPMGLLAVMTSLAILVGGILPILLLRYGFQLGG